MQLVQYQHQFREFYYHDNLGTVLEKGQQYCTDDIPIVLWGLYDMQKLYHNEDTFQNAHNPHTSMHELFHDDCKI